MNSDSGVAQPYRFGGAAAIPGIIRCVCTLTALPGELLEPDPAAARLLRIVFNRDERRYRLPGLPPRVVVAGHRRALMPIDADAGGSWIAVNDIGLVVALLNLTSTSGEHMPERHARVPRRSRGHIVPALAATASIDEARRMIETTDVAAYEPFRAVALHRQHWFEARWTGQRFQTQRGPIGRPLIWTSSSLGDDVVSGLRRALFDRVFAQRPLSSDVQDAFHHHTWDDRPEVSVRMSRADASTVSITTIDLTATGAHMDYEPIAAGETGRGSATLQFDDTVGPATL